MMSFSLQLINKIVQASSRTTLVYPFNSEANNRQEAAQLDLSQEMKKELLGGKGAVLRDMSDGGFPIPPGFTVTTEACRAYYDSGETLSDSLRAEIERAIEDLEKSVGRSFNHATSPLFVSVRSGSKFSMPGMMDTILNLGLNDDTVQILGRSTGNLWFAYDSYRRLIQMYGTVIAGVEAYLFEQELRDKKALLGLEKDSELPVEAMQEIVESYKKVLLQRSGLAFPSDPKVQLYAAIEAVFRSWMNPRALKYRELNQIPSDLGTAVNVQVMVFGNMDNNSGTGVVFTRNPINGANGLWGEFLCNAQGEEVVAGTRTPNPVNVAMAQLEGRESDQSLEVMLPDAYQKLVEICCKLEQRYGDMQDVEFTVEQGRLWILQSRNAKRSAAAAFNIARDMVADGSVSIEAALTNIQPAAIERLLHQSIDEKQACIIIGKGLAASPGAAAGVIALSSATAETWGKNGMPVILVRNETSPDDIAGMNSAKGILTAHGGMTSHAAVVARGMGKPCVCSAAGMIIDQSNSSVSFKGRVLKEGDFITINGVSGEVILGEIPMMRPMLPESFSLVMKWADEYRSLNILANAETEEDLKTAIELGAEGVGLCRTEHMFFHPERISSVRTMILAESDAERAEAISVLAHYQKADFKGIIQRVSGLPLTIRLLDPPLHEFLPQQGKDMQQYCEKIGMDIEKVKQRVAQLHEYNPMLGHRGCRLAVTYPEIYEMQVRAIFEAMIESNSHISHSNIEILIPLVIGEKEVTLMKALVARIRDEVAERNGLDAATLKYKFGVMIETPRAALLSSEIAKLVDFLSFGTNDLTQTTMGLSRDDSSAFIGEYVRQRIMYLDPFASIDKEGVGELIEIAVKRARAANPEVKIGVCGEHGGDPQSIAFFHSLGMDYVSCSPYRIPVARLAAAQAAIKSSSA